MPTIDPFSFGCGFLFAFVVPIIDIIYIWIRSKYR